MLKKTSFHSFQLFQLLRYGGLLCASIMLPRLGFNPLHISYYESFLYFTGLFTFFWVGGIMTNYLKFDQNSALIEHTLNHFFALLTFSIVSATAIVLIHFVSPIHSWNFISLFILINTPFFIIEHYLILKKSDSMLTWYGLAVFLIPPAAILGSHSIDAVLQKIILFTLVKLVFFISIFYKELFIKVKLPSSILASVTKVLLLSSPFIGAILASGSADYIDGFLVRHYFNDQDFSIYRYGARELPYVLILANALSTSLIPLLHQDRASGLLAIKNRSLLLMHLSFPVAIVLMIFSDELISLFFTKQFLPAAAIFRIYLLLIIPRLIFPQTIIQALDGGKWIFLSASIELLLNFCFSILLLQYLGLSGIALGTLLAFLFDKLFLSIVLYRKWKIAPPDYTQLTLWVAYSSLLFFAFIFKYKISC